MLKKGLAWHYVAYDQRVEFATVSKQQPCMLLHVVDLKLVTVVFVRMKYQWQKEAQAKRIGLWVQSNPEKPWEWRRKNKREDRLHCP